MSKSVKKLVEDAKSGKANPLDKNDIVLDVADRGISDLTQVPAFCEYYLRSVAVVSQNVRVCLKLCVSVSSHSHTETKIMLESGRKCVCV